ncbi:restriction endonuclease [candidate division KSB1 bacterium]|nr:restriction endonuclease [candidate division KSB1 bacterium]
MITIIASSNVKKGILFENFIKKMLDSLGYWDFRTTRRLGRQIDITAKNRVTNQPILCECKAFVEKLESNHLSKFRGIYDVEYDKNSEIVGLFFSLSGFNGSALDYYDEMTDDVKKRFKIYTDDNIINFIENSKIIFSQKQIAQIVKNKMPYHIDELYLSITEDGEFWIIIFGIDNKHSHFTVLDGKGNDVRKYIFDEIYKKDKKLKMLHPININVRNKMLIYLFENHKSNISNFPPIINESKIDVQLAIKTLKKENKIIQSGNEITLNDEFENFIINSLDFLQSKNNIEFFKSKYVQANINEQFVKYLETRYFILLSEQQKLAIIRLLKISPNALLKSLTFPTEFFKTGYNQLKRGKYSQAIKKQRNEISVVGRINDPPFIFKMHITFNKINNAEL